MPDSIFDLKQTLFTSNLPVPTPRDRGSDLVGNFDQALNSAQRQGRDDQRANNTQETPLANNKPTDETDPADDAPQAEHDEVTLSKHASETEHSKPTEPVKGKKIKNEETKTDGEKEPTAEELASAAAVSQLPLQPVLKQLPQGESEQSEQHEGLELNDAVQLGGQQRSLKSTDKKQLATTVPAETLSGKPEVVAAEKTDPTVNDPNAVVVAAELHSTTIANEKKNDAKTTNKSATDKAGPSETKQASEQTDATVKGNHDEGAFAVTVTPEAQGDEPAPKRRQETTRQSMPEVHEAPLQAARELTLNVEASTISATTDTASETTTKTGNTPEIPVISTTPTDTSTPPNNLRGQQIPSSFANRLEAAAAERKGNDGLNGVDRARFVQRVARAFQRVGETEGEIRLRLSPPELGAVKLEVSLRDGAMVARMETETTTARNLLMDNLPQLKERLAEQNIRIETFEVDVRDQANHSSADDAKEQQRQQNELQRNRLRGERATSPVVAAPIVQTLSAARQSSQLNIVI